MLATTITFLLGAFPMALAQDTTTFYTTNFGMTNMAASETGIFTYNFTFLDEGTGYIGTCSGQGDGSLTPCTDGSVIGGSLYTYPSVSMEPLYGYPDGATTGHATSLYIVSVHLEVAIATNITYTANNTIYPDFDAASAVVPPTSFTLTRV